MWPMRDVICNTSPLQYLYPVDLLHLLPTLFGSAQAQAAVVEELAEGRRHGLCLSELSGISWMPVGPVRDRALLLMDGLVNWATGMAMCMAGEVMYTPQCADLRSRMHDLACLAE